ncbi:MAG: protein kinase [Gammaproteobacteria bacterium]|nr:protein kinase [Gammaproteobacteria bacterium]
MNKNSALPVLAGYEIREVIGSGREAQTYLAVDKSSQRQVAVKIIRDDADSIAGSAFLERAGLQQSLDHPNIGKVLNYGHSNGCCFLVVEYLSGGSLNARLAGGLQTQALIKIIKDMARALDCVHAEHIVHGDVKPENILFRPNGSAVLIDFGCASLVDDRPSISPAGSVLGTPDFMSPEQLSGAALDGRADLFSLGVVLYLMLTGKLPHLASRMLGSGTSHRPEVIPQLPNDLRIFQPLIEQCLGPRPEQRPPNGQAIVAALDQLRHDTVVRHVSLKTQPITTQEIMAVGGELLARPLDSFQRARHVRRYKRKRRVRNSIGLFVLLMGGIGITFYSIEQNWFSPEQLLARIGVGEDPLLTVAWSDAQSLRQDPNQGLAAIAAGFRRVLAIAPEHLGAQEGVAGLAVDWQTSIDEALISGDLARAETRLREAREVFPNDVDWIQLAVELDNRQRAERIMRSTQGLLASNGLSDLPSATAAIQSFQEVLRLAPNYEAAQTALEDIADHYAGLASSAARVGEVSVAINLLERASAANPQLTELDRVRKIISQVATAQAAIDALLQQAREFRAANQLIKPAGRNAAELYHRVLATDPKNIFAAQGLDEVTAQITEQADQLLASGRLDDVALLVNQAASAGMSESVVNGLRVRLNDEESRLRAIDLSLAKAASLIEEGYLTAPEQENAVAYLREVQQLDPGNEVAHILLARCAEQLAAVAQEAHTYGLTDAATQYLDLALTITPEVGRWVELRSSWETDTD